MSDKSQAQCTAFLQKKKIFVEFRQKKQNPPQEKTLQKPDSQKKKLKKKKVFGIRFLGF